MKSFMLFLAVAILPTTVIAAPYETPTDQFRAAEVRACVSHGISGYAMFTSTIATPSRVFEKMDRLGLQRDPALDGAMVLAYTHRQDIKKLINSLFDHCEQAIDQQIKSDPRLAP